MNASPHQVENGIIVKISIKYITLKTIKIGFSPSKIRKIYLLKWKPFKNDEKCFLFHIKSCVRSWDIYIFVMTFLLFRKTALYFPISQDVKAFHNEIWSINRMWYEKYFPEKSYTKCGGEVSPKPFYKKIKVAHIFASTAWIVVKFVPIVWLSRGLPNILNLKCWPYVKLSLGTLCKALLKNKKRSLYLLFCVIFEEKYFSHYRGSHWRCFVKKVVLRNFANLNFAKFLRTSFFLQNTSGTRLLLSLSLLKSQNYFVKNYKSLMTLKNYSKITH